MSAFDQNLLKSVQTNVILETRHKNQNFKINLQQELINVLKSTVQSRTPLLGKSKR